MKTLTLTLVEDEALALLNPLRDRVLDLDDGFSPTFDAEHQSLRSILERNPFVVSNARSARR